MAWAKGAVARSSSGRGNAIDQLGQPALVPGMLGRSSTADASSRVAVTIVHGLWPSIR